MPLTPPPDAPPAAPEAPGAAPSRANPSTFRVLADAFVAWLVTFRDSVADLRAWLASYISWAGVHVSEIQALQEDVDAKATEVSAGAEQVSVGRAAVESIAEEFGDLSGAINAADLARRQAQTSALQAITYINSLADVPVDDADFVADLLIGRSAGVVIDATLENVDRAVQVFDTTTPANEFLGAIEDWVASTVFPQAKLCLQSDGTFKWQDHNEILQSGDPNNASWTKTNITPTTGQVGPDGTTTDATLLTVSGSTTNPRISQAITVLANRYRRQEFVVKAGTAPFIYIEVLNNAVTRRAWFNISTLAWATVDAGLTTVAPSSTKEDGTAWASGWRSLAVYGKGSGGTSDQVRIGLSDTDGGTTCTLGRTVTIAQLQSHRGVKRLKYLATTTASRRGVPYDWTNGERQVRLDVAVNYRGRSGDDLTNATYWTPSNITPALDATGPHGEPCSSITATAANGTITQAVTSSGAFQTTFAYVRRRTGSGTLEMSVNNGSTWTDVTADVGEAGGTYGLVYVKSSLANPTAVFRVGTAGDVFEVALFNVAACSHVPSPVPAVLIDYASLSDAFSLPFTGYPNGSEMTVYADVHLPTSAIGASGFRTKVGFFGAGSLASTVDINVQPTLIRMEHLSNDGTARTVNFGNFNSAGRLQIQHRVKANDYSIAYNGNPAWWNDVPGSIAFDRFTFSVGQSLWLRRLLIVPEAISDDGDDLRLFKLDTTDSNVDPNILASSFVYKSWQVANTNESRLPTLEMLYQRGDVCGFICAWGVVRDGGYDPEHPQRMMQRRGEFDRSTSTITWLEDATVILEPASWSSGLGGVQGYTMLKVKVGPYRGRLLMFYVQQDSVSGTKTDDARNLYLMYSDDNGDTWSAGVKILDKSVFLGATKGFLCTGENSTAFQFEDGPHAGRVYIPLNMNNQFHYAMWSDEFKQGATPTVPGQPGMSSAAWSRSTTPVSSSTGFGTMSEPNIAFWPDQSIVMLFRNTSSGVRGFATSSDYGVTFTAASQIAGDNESSSVNGALLQDDPTGQRGRRGRLIYMGSTVDPRSANKVQSARDDALTMEDSYRLFPPARFVGYCALRRAFDDEDIYLAMVEVQPTFFSAERESQMLVAFRY